MKKQKIKLQLELDAYIFDDENNIIIEFPNIVGCEELKIEI